MVEQGEPPTLEAGTVVAGRYKVLHLIGKGGMGVVYRAEHVHMRKTVALKVLHREYLKVEEVVARFEREAVAAARIEHPNVVAASDFGKLEDGSFYLVLEFVDGQSLRSLIEESGALPLGRTIRIAQQTLQALGAAHGNHIVHRDLKPDNVMLVADAEGEDRVKVLDFGIARVAGPEARDATKLTQMGMVMGTVAYMSPEQATGQPVDERADLYSFGVMLYEMIAGVVPFDAELPSQVLARQLVEEPPPLPVGTPEPLVRLVMDLMQKKPEDRPASAQEVLERLAELTATPSGRVVAPPSGPPRVVFYAAGGAVVLFAILGLALSGGESEDGAASAEPAASSVPAATGSAPPGAEASEPPKATPSVTPAPVAPPPPSAEARPADSSSKTARPATKSTAKTAKSKSPPPPTNNPPKRKTGPGGIYIPPPSEWFN
ncbi:MAG TPA: serine/threonine-protein kinase [Polyangiaceae bacterium]|nr:serine/threonine-protein kinase [Polyangiaceae bacterium]